MSPVKISVSTLFFWLLASLVQAADFIPSAIKDDSAEQAKEAERAFDDQRYADAYEIYQEVLAPRGDKYAQYMIGYMYLNGLGKDADPVRAAAWLKLAAERNDQAFVQLSDKVWQNLDSAAQNKAEENHANLQALYGDCKVMRTMLKEEKDLLTPVTGTRLTSNVALPVTRRTGAGGYLKPEDRSFLRELQKERKQYLKEHCKSRDARNR